VDVGDYNGRDIWGHKKFIENFDEEILRKDHLEFRDADCKIML